MKKILLALCLAALAGITGCIPTSINPLYDGKDLVFDPALIGAWREKDATFPIDAAGRLPGDRAFNSPAELKQILLGEKDAFTLALAEKLMTYALGRGLEPYDKPELRRIAKAVALNEYKMGSMMKEIVESPAFQMRRGDGGRKHDQP